MKLSGVTSVLVAASDQDLHNQVARVLKEIGAENIVMSMSTEDASVKLLKESFHLVIIDQKMHRLAGLNLIQQIRGHVDSRVANTPILVVVGTMTKSEISLLRETEYIRPIKKPFSDILLAAKVFEVLTCGDVTTANSHLDTMDYDQLTRVVTEAMRNNQLDLAEEVITRRLASDDKSPRLHNLVAQLRFAQGRLDEAFQTVERILETNPDFLPALNVKAKISVRLGLFDQALEIMERAQKISPLNTQRLLAMGELHLGFGRLNAAREKFKRALEIYPDLERARIGMARTLAEAGDRQEAQKIIRTLTDPMVVVSELNLKGVVLAKSCRFSEATSLYDKALSCSSGARTDAAILYNMALAYFKDRKVKEADEKILLSVQLDPDFEKAARLRRRIHARYFFPENETYDADLGECLLTETQIKFLTGTLPPAPQPGAAVKKSHDEDTIDYEQLRNEPPQKVS